MRTCIVFSLICFCGCESETTPRQHAPLPHRASVATELHVDFGEVPWNEERSKNVRIETDGVPLSWESGCHCIAVERLNQESDNESASTLRLQLMKASPGEHFQGSYSVTVKGVCDQGTVLRMIHVNFQQIAPKHE